jgi:RNA polymerase sigma-70 factor (ECF subfamily)
MVYTAIDHFRKNHKHQFTTDLDNGVVQVASHAEDALDRISYEEIIRSIQDLTPGYRTVFNLFIIEGFTHEEISDKLVFRSEHQSRIWPKPGDSCKKYYISKTKYK